MDDRIIIQKIKKGDTHAFETFFNSYYSLLCIYLQSFSLDKDTAQELAQQVFVKFWEKRKKIVISTSAKAYLYRMAYNEFLMRKRKKKEVISELDRLTQESLREYEDISAQALEEKSQGLKKSIQKLPPACQNVLRLKMNGATYKEIALEMNISIKTVESQMRIAYTKLREDLKDVLFLFLLNSSR